MEKNSRRSKLFVIAFVALILVIVFIFSNSLPDKETSKEISMSFGDMIAPFLKFFLKEQNVTDHLIRKMAHFVEYSLLGAVWAFLFCMKKNLNFKCILVMYLSPIWIAVIDETIQIFTGRGAMIPDVWLDYGGAFCGCSVVLLMYGIFLWKCRR